VEYFETTGALRRQVELHLVASIAAVHAGRRSRSSEGPSSLARAADLLQHARLVLHGPIDDPFAGDLPYLLARASRAGLPEALPEGPNGEPASPEMLFQTARWNYRQGGLPEASFSVDLEAARGAVVRATHGRALRHIEAALRRATEDGSRRRIQRTLGVFVQLMRRLDLSEASEAVAEWTGEASRRSIPETARVPRAVHHSGEKRASAVADWLDRRLATPYGRRLLASELAGLRADPDLATRPPPALVTRFREADPDETIGRADWRLGHQAGLLLDEQGYRSAARGYFRRAVDSLEAIRSTIPDPTLRQTFFADKRPVYRALVDSYVGRQTADRRASLYRRALRTANGLKARGLIDLLRGAIAPEQTVEARRFVWESPSDLRDAADQVLEQLDAWRPSTDRDPPPSRFGADFPESLLDELDSETAVLEYMLGPGRSYVWVMTDSGIQMRRIAGERTLEPLVSDFLDTVVEPDPTAEQTRRHRRLGERLYVELLGPIEDLLANHDRLVIAADESLYRLPFEALIRPVRDGHGDYVSRHRVVSYTPSSAALTMMESDGRDPHDRRALLMGAPDLDRPAIDLLSIADDLPRSGMFSMREMFPELPGSDRELEGIEHLLSSRGHLAATRRTGAEATEHFLRTSDLESFGVIHLATHGVSDARPLTSGPAREVQIRQPALMLAHDPSAPDDGLLTLGELLSYRTGADMVVLSGCTTGRGWRALGDGAYGLAGAFLFTGADHVVASTWDVADRDTTDLMRHVYRALADGTSPSAALNAGQRAMLDRQTGGDPRSPYVWAGFRSVGGLP
jgi:CHAT domain-containing protein